MTVCALCHLHLTISCIVFGIVNSSAKVVVVEWVREKDCFLGIFGALE